MTTEKLKLQATFFQLLLRKICFVFFKTALLYLKVISNIASESIYRERRTKVLPN